jgi:hypothetical protein
MQDVLRAFPHLQGNKEFGQRWNAMMQHFAKQKQAQQQQASTRAGRRAQRANVNLGT